MSNYKSSLAAVVRVRRHLTEEAVSAFMDVQGRLVSSQGRLAEEQEKLEMAVVSFTRGYQNGATGAEVGLYHDLMQLGNIRVANCQADVYQLSSQCDVQREHLSETMKEKIVVETIDRRRRHAYEGAIVKKLQRITDEVAGQQVRRNGRVA